MSKVSDVSFQGSRKGFTSEALQHQLDRSGSIDVAAQALRVPRDQFRDLSRRNDDRAQQNDRFGDGTRVGPSDSSAESRVQPRSTERDGQPCVSCTNETDTGVWIFGDINFHAAVLCVAGLPLDEAVALVDCLVDVNEPHGYVLCPECANLVHVTPKPISGPMPLLSPSFPTREVLAMIKRLEESSTRLTPNGQSGRAAESSTRAQKGDCPLVGASAKRSLRVVKTCQRGHTYSTEDAPVWLGGRCPTCRAAGKAEWERRRFRISVGGLRWSYGAARSFEEKQRIDELRMTFLDKQRREYEKFTEQLEAEVEMRLVGASA